MPVDPPPAPASAPASVRHPRAGVPDRLFDDPDAEARWRRRFTAVRTSLPHRSRDDADRTCYTSNATGRTEVWCWDVAADRHAPATDRPDGTTIATLSADGSTLWWFDDHEGDEFGSWRAQPFGTGPASGVGSPLPDVPRPDVPLPEVPLPDVPLPDVPPGYPAGLEVGRRVVLAGFADDDGSRIHLSLDGGPARVVYRHAEDASVGALTTDESVWVLAHSEHGDARYPALRAISVADGRVLGELSDAPGRGLEPLAVGPVAGDTRILVGHERRSRDELLIWDPVDGSVTELVMDLPGDVEADFTPDGSALIVLHTHAGRTTVHSYDLASGRLTDLPTARGVVAAATARPDGSVWYRWTDGATAGRLRVLTPDGADAELFRPPGDPAPGSEPVRDLWVDGPGGPIHAFLAIPGSPGWVGRTGAAPPTGSGGPTPEAAGPFPTVFDVHGGPAAADEDAFDAARAAWLDAGFAVVQVNYRGSTGYGSAWRDALTERIGHTELADIAAVHDHLVDAGVVDPARSVIAGYSWGGFLTLLALGTQPERWVAGAAGVPVADYVAAYEDEMEPLRAYDRALFGGAPTDVPDAYRDSSPLTWADQVRAPVLVLAGENDPRCPIRQIDNYLDALARRGHGYAVYRYDAGHGSGVVAERVRQLAVEIAFVRGVLAELDQPDSGRRLP